MSAIGKMDALGFQTDDQHERFDIVEFDSDEQFFGRTDLILVAKSFDLEGIRKRYLQSIKRGRIGSVTRRMPSLGGIIHVIIEEGRVARHDIIARIYEPRGIDLSQSKLAVSSENKIFIFDINADKPEVIEHPWLSYIHSVRFNSDGRRLLVSSAGCDTILEFDLESRKVTWEWLAWENGYKTGVDPRTNESHLLTRCEREAKEIERLGSKVILVTNPKKNPLPTALRAAFINGAEYIGGKRILATLFHHGCVVAIEKEDKSGKVIIDGLSRPHGGMYVNGKYLVTDTGKGRVLLASNGRSMEYDFSRLPRKAKEVGSAEWLQFSRMPKENLIISADSNRCQIIWVDMKKRKRMEVDHPVNLAVQEFIVISSRGRGLVRKMALWFQNQAGYNS
jgi:hypothetical protein